jgi:hypothetical protein
VGIFSLSLSSFCFVCFFCFLIHEEKKPQRKSSWKMKIFQTAAEGSSNKLETPDPGARLFVYRLLSTTATTTTTD